MRGIEGHYNLKEELARLRSMPRVIRGTRADVQRRPAGVQPSLCGADRRDGSDAAHSSRGVRAERQRIRSTDMSTRRRSTSSTARVTKFTTASATTGRPVTLSSSTTTACISITTRARRGRPGRSCMKTKPMYLFMNMLFQKTVEPRPTEPAPGAEGFKAREEEENFNHD